MVLDLLGLSLWQVKGFTPRERQDLVERIQRSLPKCPDGLRPKLVALHAECERHQGNPVTADDLYRRAAEGCLTSNDLRIERDKAPILAEAATVALSRGHTPAQAERAIRYLEPIQDGTGRPPECSACWRKPLRLPAIQPRPKLTACGQKTI